MAPRINIKDEQTVMLARELARQSGKTLTATVREALKEMRARHATEKSDDSRSA